MALRKIGILILLLAVGFLAACRPPPYAGDPESVRQPTSCKPIDYENGVFFFSCRQADFGNALSRFKKETSYEIEAMSEIGHGVGHFVSVRLK